MSTFVSEVSVAEIGALVGDTGRVQMLTALLTGEALTAGELAWHAGITAQTASGHLARLTQAGLLSVVRQGRHRYYRLASPLVAQMLEGIAVVAATHGPPRHRSRSRIDEALRAARTCYDHLAGRLAVAVAQSLVDAGRLEWSGDGGILTPKGGRFLSEFGLDLQAAAAGRRQFCRPCLDWSERRLHIAGAIGAGVAGRLFELGWITRIKDSRAVAITPTGADGFRQAFGIDAPAIVAAGDQLRPAAA